MSEPKKRALGKGLGALIGGAPVATAVTSRAEDMQEPSPDGARLIWLDPTRIKPNPHQPRINFEEESLQELAESLRRDGLQEPVIVRQVGDEYELVSGERRVRAAVMADLPRIPALLRDVPDRDMLRLGLIENIQRENLNPIETARAYARLQEEFHWTQEELAAQVGKNRATVANTLRLLSLPEDVQAAIAQGKISGGHAKALLQFPTPEQQRRIARRIIEEGLSVREVEALAQRSPREKGPRSPQRSPKDPNIAVVEQDLRRILGTKVTVRNTKQGKGCIQIEYYSADDLGRILDLLKKTR